MYILSTNCLRFNVIVHVTNNSSTCQPVYSSTCQPVYSSTCLLILQRVHIIIYMERSITLVCKYFVSYITQALSNFWQINTILEF